MPYTQSMQNVLTEMFGSRQESIFEMRQCEEKLTVEQRTEIDKLIVEASEALTTDLPIFARVSTAVFKLSIAEWLFHRYTDERANDLTPWDVLTIKAQTLEFLTSAAQIDNFLSALLDEDA